MTVKELRQQKRKLYENKYKLVKWDRYKFRKLGNILYTRRSGRGTNDTYSDCIIMADTETSKGVQKGIYENHMVAFTISIRAYDLNIVTLYGNKPSEFIETLKRLKKHLEGDKIIIYWHNMSYDWVFIRKFMLSEFGTPVKLLATKPHYPIYIEFENGLIFKDSLILAQRSLEKWAEDLKVDHKKAVGKWDYDKIRNQSDSFSDDELEYIEHDTLAGVECLDALMKQLKKRIYSMPYTATGIPREEVRKRGKKNNARALFERCVSKDYHVQELLENVYHGGYTHANRHIIGLTQYGSRDDPILALDFTSSYPYCMCAFKFPMTEFKLLERPETNGVFSPEEILKMAETYAFMFKLVLVNVRLKNDHIPMPALQKSKCVRDMNCVLDNGRILCADFVEIYMNEIDLNVIRDQYEWQGQGACIEVYYSEKQYLPRWFTDYVFECFYNKTMLKEDKKHPQDYDPVAYALAKSIVNSLYGMCVQKPCKEEITEIYGSGDYLVGLEYLTEKEKATLPAEDQERLYKQRQHDHMIELYDKYLNNNNNVLNYAWGVWVTSYAFSNLFELGACCGDWFYSDTDSCYGKNWDKKAVDAYNEGCKDKLKANGYGAVIRDGKEYWLGVVDADEYIEFKTVGAKRYCVRYEEFNEKTGRWESHLKLTVAGVPKKRGALCLEDDIENFCEGFIFSGIMTGKQTHTYFFSEDIHTDDQGNEIGDSIDLSPCDYLLSSVEIYDWEKLFEEEIKVQTYED